MSIRVTRPRAAAGALLGVLLVSGCGTGGQGSGVGAVAAEVGEQTITTADVDTLTDALCTSFEIGGDYRNLGLRSTVQQQLVARLVQAAMVDDLGLAEDTEPTLQESDIPGWDQLTASQQDALWSFIGGDARRQAALTELAASSGAENADPATAGLAALAAQVEEEGVDVSVNPRYGLEVEDGELRGAAQLSVPVSDFAEAGDAPDLAHLRSLPADQVCGPMPPEGMPG